MYNTQSNITEYVSTDMSGGPPLLDFNVEDWPRMCVEHPRKIVSDIVSRYHLPNGTGYDTTKMETECSHYIVPLLERVMECLHESFLASDPVCMLIRGVNACLATASGQAYARSHDNVVTVLLRCIRAEYNLTVEDILDTLQSLLCLILVSGAEVTSRMQELGASHDLLILMKRHYVSRPIHAICRRILYHLGLTTSDNRKGLQTLMYSSIILDLLGTPHVACKESGLQLLCMSLSGKHRDSFRISTDEWKNAVLPHHCRLLFCSTQPTQGVAVYCAACYLLHDSAAPASICQLLACALVVSILDLPIIDLVTPDMMILSLPVACSNGVNAPEDSMRMMAPQVSKPLWYRLH